jgi:hypothetical protein
MANYRTQFSCLFDVGSAENVAHAEAIRAALRDDLDRLHGEDIGFAMEPHPEEGPSVLWIHAEECGEPEHVLAFVRRCSGAFGLEGRWGFCWALTCSKPRLDGFGGGAHVLDLATGTTVAWIDCSEWLAERLLENEASAANAAAGEGAP